MPIQVLDEEGKPLSDLTLKVESDGDSEELSTDSDGIVESEITGKIKVTLETESEESEDDNEDESEDDS